MSQLSTILPGAGQDTVKQGFDKVIINFGLLQETFSDTVAPTSPVTGQQYIDSTTATRLKAFVRQNGAWAAALLTHLLEEDLDFDRNQAVKFIAEKLASDPTPAAAEEGRLHFNTVLKRFVLSLTADSLLVPGIEIGIDYVGIDCVIKAIGSTGTVIQNEIDFIELDVATTEEFTVIPVDVIPVDFVGNQDLLLRVRCAIGGGSEVANDDFQMQGNMVSVALLESFNKAETALVAATQDVGSDNAQYKRHDVTLVVDHDDGTNPVGAGDSLRFTLNSSLFEINPTWIQKATLLVPVKGHVDEQ